MSQRCFFINICKALCSARFLMIFGNRLTVSSIITQREETLHLCQPPGAAQMPEPLGVSARLHTERICDKLAIPCNQPAQ